MTLNDYTNDLLSIMDPDFTIRGEEETDDEYAFRMETLATTLDGILAEQGDKMDDYAHVIRKLTADADFLKAEKQRLERRQKAAEANVQRMKDALLRHMTVTGQPKIKTQKNTFFIKTNQKAVVDDMNKVPDEMLRVKVEADLVKLKAALKLGIECGAHLEDSQSLTIR